MGSFYNPYVILYVCTKFEADISKRSKVIKGSENFEIGSRDPSHAQLEVVLGSLRRKGIRPQSVCTKFEADCTIRSKVIKGSQNVEIGSRDPKPRPF